jgi:hypothetical protein
MLEHDYLTATIRKTLAEPQACTEATTALNKLIQQGHLPSNCLCSTLDGSHCTTKD